MIDHCLVFIEMVHIRIGFRLIRAHGINYILCYDEQQRVMMVEKRSTEK